MGHPEVLFEVGWDLSFPAGDAPVPENEKIRFHDLYVPTSIKHEYFFFFVFCPTSRSHNLYRF